MGATTIMAGMTNTKTDGMTTAKSIEDSKSQNIAIKYVMGNVDLLGNYLRRSSGLTQAQATDQDTSIATNAAGNLYTGTYATTAKLLGLGANYNFSKNTLLYVRYESIKGLNANVTTQTAATNGILGVGNYSGASQSTSAIGIKMVF
jgi:predicted porin